MRLENAKSGQRLVPVNNSATSLMAADMLKVTSGSAGEPKAIRFSCAQLLAIATTSARRWELGRGCELRRHRVFAFLWV